jgi:hypothetical protein
VLRARKTNTFFWLIDHDDGLTDGPRHFFQPARFSFSPLMNTGGHHTYFFFIFHLLSLANPFYRQYIPYTEVSPSVMLMIYSR